MKAILRVPVVVCACLLAASACGHGVVRPDESTCTLWLVSALTGDTIAVAPYGDGPPVSGISDVAWAWTTGHCEPEEGAVRRSGLRNPHNRGQNHDRIVPS